MPKLPSFSTSSLYRVIRLQASVYLRRSVPTQAHVLAEVTLAGLGVAQHLAGRAVAENPPAMDDVAAPRDLECLQYLVVYDRRPRYDRPTFMPEALASRRPTGVVPKIRRYKSSAWLVGKGSPSTSRNVRRPSASLSARRNNAVPIFAR